ncbi:MAG: hypothetical protein ACTSWN_05720 [Promethearchaeota archaeon]
MPELNENSRVKNEEDFDVGSYAALFICLCIISFSPATTFCYLFFINLNPIFIYITFDSLELALITLFVGLTLAYFVLLLGAWIIAKVGVFVVHKGKKIPEGVFQNSYNDEEWQKFSKRHVAKKFSIWLFKHFAPLWLYKIFIGSFIKIGKNSTIPEWVAMELAEIGENTVFARESVFSSHIIDGELLTVKKIKIGNNCIVDANDENDIVLVAPGAIIEDNVILKPGSFVKKDMVLKEGGIYAGRMKVKRIGEVRDLPKEELERLRKEVRKKRKLKSTMVKEWSEFKSVKPKLIKCFSILIGTLSAATLLTLTIFLLIPTIIQYLGTIGHAINLIILPIIIFIAYGFQVYIPIPLFFAGFRHYEKNIPKLPDDNPDASLEISDPEIIEQWKKNKWLKWQSVQWINESLFPDTSILLYKYLGNNDIAFQSVLYNAVIDTDYVSIGKGTVFSFACHVYAYKLEKQPKLKLTIKRTRIGKNCIIASSIIKAGACIKDNVVVGIHSVVPENAVLESGKTYVGIPAMEINEYLKSKKNQQV